jgi:hypothetical protein
MCSLGVQHHLLCSSFGQLTLQLPTLAFQLLNLFARQSGDFRRLLPVLVLEDR